MLLQRQLLLLLLLLLHIDRPRARFDASSSHASMALRSIVANLSEQNFEQLETIRNILDVCRNCNFVKTLTLSHRNVHVNGKKYSGRPIISEHIVSIFTKFSRLVDRWTGLINLSFILRSLRGRCYGKQLDFGANRRHCQIPPSFFAVAFHNASDNHNAVLWRSLFAT